VLGEVADAVGGLALRFGRGNALLSAAGSVLRLPGADGPGVLDGDSEALALAWRLVELGRRPAAFLWRESRREGWHRIELAEAEDADLAGYQMVVSATPVGRPYGLTARELEVLTLMARGWTNREIAESLVVATGTVRVHVE
jgi:DNA-binding NarL/FixJ family response regulator